MTLSGDFHRLDAFSHNTDGHLFVRATAIAMHGQGAVFIGASGSGKSRLALQMMALGAELIADDGIFLDDQNLVKRPANALPMIEARGIGLLGAAVKDCIQLALVVDLDRPEPDRFPPRHLISCPGGPVDLIHGRDHPYLAVALCQYLRQGRTE